MKVEIVHENGSVPLQGVEKAQEINVNVVKVYFKDDREDETYQKASITNVEEENGGEL